MSDFLTDDDLLLDSSKTEVDGSRPVFLTVLCILTFVGAGLGLIYQLYTIMMLNAAEEMLNGIAGTGPNDLDFGLGNYYRWSKIKVYVSVPAELLCVGGAVFMMFLKRFGFFMYVAGQLAPLAIAFMLFLSSRDTFQEFGILIFALTAIFPVGFIILYSLNYKHLR